MLARLNENRGRRPGIIHGEEDNGDALDDLQSLTQ